MPPSPPRAPRLPWPPLISGTLLGRTQRFLAHVRLRDGRVVTAHCPNSGSMRGCSELGRTVYLSRHLSPRRRTRYTWEIIAMPGTLVGINTLLPNRLIHEAASAQAIPELRGYTRIRKEVPYGKGSRIDLLLEKDGQRCFVEVKNCTLVEEGTALFPDAVTERGRKHLKELQMKAEAGDRAVMLFLVQGMDARRFEPAWHIDPAYAKTLAESLSAGVEILVYDVHLDLKSVGLRSPLPWSVPPRPSPLHLRP